eukprot:CAMPEP_0202969454 /NCGR_PEP_ID=MMETSP1396-20130829/15187_1 /ASSEMBLY_ACC=CAM_ASM_000872 /TAXON_ID= /ORGANISM="Pseudokeronopsis sp., Strain Brazil" /LENGTH=145 /DNA_ID=CAMNT_0049697005 /DNA_START=109 /DNA_END=546 /DNA_ORIENTATION=-
MFKDIKQAEEVVREFRGEPHDRKSKERQVCELEVSILSMAMWPMEQCKQIVVIPRVLADLQSDFEAFYKKKFNGRLLHWHFGHSSALLSAKFDCSRQPYTLAASGLQTVILLAFNAKHSCNPKELAEETKIDFDLVQQCLEHLST